MKKVKSAPKSEMDDWLRPEYARSELGTLERGKYARRLDASSNVVVLDPQVAEAFPNDEAVNNALRGLLELARSSARLGSGKPGPKRSRRQPGRAGTSARSAE